MQRVFWLPLAPWGGCWALTPTRRPWPWRGSDWQHSGTVPPWCRGTSLNWPPSPRREGSPTLMVSCSIWGFPPCSLLHRSEGSLSNRMGHWTCALILPALPPPLIWSMNWERGSWLISSIGTARSGRRVVSPELLQEPAPCIPRRNWLRLLKGLWPGTGEKGAHQDGSVFTPPPGPSRRCGLRSMVNCLY